MSCFLNLLQYPASMTCLFIQQINIALSLVKDLFLPGPTYSALDEMATTTCTGLTDAQGYVIAVRRDCGKRELSCADICEKTPRDAGINIVSSSATQSS